MRFDVAAPDEFLTYLQDADGDVYFKAHLPVFDGQLAAASPRNWPVQSHAVTIERSALMDGQWRTSIRNLFIDFAAETSAVLATAEVVRDVTWSGRSLGYSGQTERTTYLAVRGHWSGLPPYPLWWTWFGADYAPLVASHLSADSVERVGECLFHWRSEEPATRDDLQQALTANAPTRGCLRRLPRRQPPPVAPAPWLPAELLPIESVSNTILEHLDKGHTVADASNAVR